MNIKPARLFAVPLNKGTYLGVVDRWPATPKRAARLSAMIA